MKEELDPELAALLDIPDLPAPPESGVSAFHRPETAEPSALGTEETEIAASGFPKITKRFEDRPEKALSDPHYYKQILTGEGDRAQRLHGLLQKYLNATDPADRGIFRQQLVPAFWDLLFRISLKVVGKLPPPKKYLLRFGILSPSFLDIEDRDLFARVVVENELSQPVYYLDEWFKAVGTAVIRPSTTDEAPVSQSNTAGRFQRLLEKARGKLEGTQALLRTKSAERAGMEKALVERLQVIMAPKYMEGLPDINACYDEAQKRAIAEAQELLKGLLKSDRELEVFSRDFYQAKEDVDTIRKKMEESGQTEEVDIQEVDVQAVETEFSTIRQMAKMTIGRQGNQFPILTREYFRATPNEIGTRENVVSLLAQIEDIDPEVFFRIYRNKANRIVPYVILLPTYGDRGVCWEPFSRLNRATSRGRLALPMYPRNLTIALLSAVADLRWQVAKEKAAYYWMEEGLTGNYYQYFSARKLKGDVKVSFIDDYIGWITKESEGIQKLDKEVRSIFWRYMPFSQPIKEKLRTRSIIYQELYQRDLNRARSDGY